ncbi:hypothetical protein L210DRAFT_3502767 [Boletus edulis BED1]|uniref:Uncharacterized protein n=1 Tax=Boletus edulis BED1 TaxID=1328754 RepID=A0AAD4BYE7_BOLED|nr:hypothetical protein L210DRAFT_3502767 [Boletus edulis BED1]
MYITRDLVWDMESECRMSGPTVSKWRWSASSDGSDNSNFERGSVGFELAFQSGGTSSRFGYHAHGVTLDAIKIQSKGRIIQNPTYPSSPCPLSIETLTQIISVQVSISNQAVRIKTDLSSLKDGVENIVGVQAWVQVKKSKEADVHMPW